MDWLIRGIRGDATLTRWENKPFSAGVEDGPRPRDKVDNHERVVGFEAPGPPAPEGFARLLGDAILRFDVFPSHLLKSVTRRRPVEVGDTVGLCYPFVPGVQLFFAARVFDRFEETTDTLWRCGFRYRTLEGHPACGEETFIVEKELLTGKVTVALRSWSRPGLLIARLTYPVMRAHQLKAARSALDHLEQLAHPNRYIGVSTAASMSRNLRTGLF